jgi:hypothetical protein
MAVRDPDPMADSAEVRAAAQRRVNANAWNLLLLVPLVGTLIPSIYNKADPTLWGIPFFYWYQLAWIFVSVVITVIVYKMTRGER